MSSIKLESNASGTGIFTIASPNSNTNRTLILPDSAGTSGQVLSTNGSGTLSWAAGTAVVQVKNTLMTTLRGIASSTFADITGLSATITPTSASNKILVLVSINGMTSEASVTSLRTRILRDSTTLDFIDSSIGYLTMTTPPLYAGGVSISYLDSPATTSAITYKIQFATNNGNQAYINNYTTGGSSSTITLMEVTP